MSDNDLYGRYYQRAEKHITIELVIDIAVALLIWIITEYWLYALIFVCFAFIKARQLNTKNRQLEILNRLDEIENKINEK
jgi:hypothetical protein